MLARIGFPMRLSLATSPLAFRDELESILGSFLEERRRELAPIDAGLSDALGELSALAGAGGKRIRPWFVEWGHRAAGGDPDHRLAHAAAAVEMLHTFALIQDDIIDRSELRRGRPAVHIALGGSHGRHHGSSAALLLSDLAFVWSDLLLCRAGYAGRPLTRAREVFNVLREEVIVGQFQDLSLTSAQRFDMGAALEVNLRKTAGYTVLRPIELGMALADAPAALVAGAGSYARPVGQAFQLRDDLLGAFGDSRVTGKPDGDDLAAAKSTWLLARGLAHQGRAGAELQRLVGLPARGHAEVELMREALVAAGAVSDAERLIERLRARALRCADRLPISESCRAELDEVTARLVDRAS